MIRYMVSLSRRLPLVAICTLLLGLTGCAPLPKVTKSPDFTVSPNQEVMPVVPFANILVPNSFAETVFNTFVDTLNDNRASTSIKWFTIIKEDMKEVAQTLPPDHLYLAGELWSYIEDSGCCSTELRVKGRLRFYSAVYKEPLLEIQLPMESFFEHDNSSLVLERERLAQRLAGEMSKQVLKVLQIHTVQQKPQ